jgi:hypothetical protein
MASVTQQAIKVCSAKTFAAMHRVDSAWRRRAPHILREQGGLVHAIHFQGSQFGSNEEGSFTVNFSVSSRPIYEAWTGRSFPANPATALFPIQKRIGHFLADRRDHWWSVTESSNLEELSLSVTTAVSSVADSFFSRYVSLDAMLVELRATGTLPGLTKHQAPVVHGIVAAIQNQPREAEAAFRKAMESPIGAFRETVALVASRVGLTVVTP